MIDYVVTHLTLQRIVLNSGIKYHPDLHFLFRHFAVNAKLVIYLKVGFTSVKINKE
jgi:hypothetical protein